VSRLAEAPPLEGNIAQALVFRAQAQPEGRALIFGRPGRYQSWTFARLNRTADSFAHGLARAGIEAGQRVLLLVRSGPEFVALVFALFKMGAAPVLLDPGMGLPMALRCIENLQPEALVGIPLAQLLRRLLPGAFRSVRRAVTVGPHGLPGAPALDRLAAPERGPFPLAPAAEGQEAAVLFTSGSTGPAKGVVYEHSMFWAQVRALGEMFGFAPGEIDMPGFPLFALFSTALGMTCLLPDLNPSRPARCHPARLVRALQDWQATSCQGSPAIWTRVGRWCRERGLRLPSLRRVITFGCAIPPGLVETWREILSPQADLHTPYGATEALPVSTISGREILEHAAGRTAAGGGTCVGRPAPGIDLRILRLVEGPIPTWREDLVLPPGEIGEVVVSGPVVTRRYAGLPEETARAKIAGPEGRTWHRMGDAGYLDEQGRLWFCGRVAHRVQGRNRTYFSVCAEEVFNRHPDVFRSALVGVGPPGEQEPVLVVQTEDRPVHRGRLAAELLALAAQDPQWRDIRRVLFHPSFPVDPRHNAKIHREELARWAARQLP
jgi:acyl-CoA synthetase (AMP-forming)/AMP-acid ligase II